MAQNVSYAAGDVNLESLLLHIMPDYGPHGDGIINSNILTAYLKDKGARKVSEGGLELWYGISKQENSNAKWQGKNDDMTANVQDPTARLRFPWRIFTSSVVLNDLDKARNKGRAAIKNYLLTLREQAVATNENLFNSGLWNTSPGADEPESVPRLIPTTNTSGTIGGLDRSGNTYLQNGVYSTAISDIGSEAGIAKMLELKVKYSVGRSQADLIMLDEANYAGLVGYLQTEKRYRGNEMMAKMGFDTVMLTAMCTVGYENRNVLGGANTIADGYMYGINSKYTFINVLADGDNKWETAFERIGTKLNKALFYKLFCQFTTNCPRANWVASSVSTS